MRTSDIAPRIGAAAVIFLVLTLAAMHAIQPGLDPARHYVSEYAYGSWGILLQAGYVAAGVGVVLLAWSVGGWLSWRRWSVIAAACLLLIGVGLTATGLTRIDLPGGGGATSASGMVHELAGYLAILGLVAGGFSLSLALGRAGYDGLRGRSRRYAWILVGAVVATIAFQRLELIGLGQRLFLAAAMSWLIWIGIQAGWSSTRARFWAESSGTRSDADVMADA